MVLYGYVRASPDGRELRAQEDALRTAGCEAIVFEKRNSRRQDGHHELPALLDRLRTGDTLLVTRLDRLARSLTDLQKIVAELRMRGASLRAVEQPIDTGAAEGQAFLDMLDVFTEFETSLSRERQLEEVVRQIETTG